MSTPPNILAQFRTYSYHNTIVLADSTETAELLSRAGTNFERPGDEIIVQSVDGYPNNKFIILIDPTKDAYLSAPRLRWETRIVPPRRDGKPFYNTFEQDGELVIQEVGSIAFLNILRNATQALGCEYARTVLVIKTTFIGHTDDGKTRIINDVRPSTFMAHSIKAESNESGTTYIMSLLGINNGAAKIPSMSAVANGLSLRAVRGATVYSTLKSLEAEMNHKYRRSIENLKETSEANGTPMDINKFILLKYRIDVDPVYQDDSYKVGEMDLPQHADMGESDTIFTIGANSDPESIMDMIMKSSGSVLADKHLALGGREDRYIHKITSTIESTPTEMTIVYHVNRYKYVKASPDEELGAPTMEPENGTGIEFDYMFTGKNVDVLSFKLSHNLGVMYLMNTISGKNIPHAGEAISGADFSNGITLDVSNTIETENRTKQILFPSVINQNNNVRNKRNPVLSEQAEIDFAFMAAASSQVEILGNPQLLNDIVRLPSEMRPGDSNKSAPVKGSDGAIVENIFNAPAMCKVNVRAPTGYGEGEYRQFWFKGWYYITKIENDFDEGKFIQRLDLMAIPVTNIRENDTALTEEVTESGSGRPPQTDGINTNSIADSKGKSLSSGDVSNMNKRSVRNITADRATVAAKGRNRKASRSGIRR